MRLVGCAWAVRASAVNANKAILPAVDLAVLMVDFIFLVYDLFQFWSMSFNTHGEIQRVKGSVLGIDYSLLRWHSFPHGPQTTSRIFRRNLSRDESRRSAGVKGSVPNIFSNLNSFLLRRS